MKEAPKWGDGIGKNLALWAGYVLFVGPYDGEDGQDWYWGVDDEETGLQIGHSTDHDEVVPSQQIAQQRAEAAARNWLSPPPVSDETA